MAYGGVRVLRDVDLRVEAGEFVTFLGPSGSGKTTTLNLIAGFLQPVQGEILLDGRDLTRIPAYQRGIGVVFQSYALFPHMTVAENIAYPLQQRRPRPGREAIARRVDAVLDLVQMRAYADRRPDQLSGGQQQRVALARAVVFEPQLLLLDEPLGALDKRLRESLQGELRRIHRELGVTVVFVTHDQDEALSLSDRIVLFHDGAIEQVGTPEEIYDRPRTAFAAGFLGDSNLFEGRLERGVFSGAAGRFAALPGAPDGPATLMVRPEHVRLLPAGAPLPEGLDNAVPVVLDDAVFAGATVRVEAIGPDGRRLLAQGAGLDRRIAPGSAAQFAWPASATRLLAGGAA
ncbi:putrescine transport ATP-binding protein PotA [Piscinibacter sakaiensis]|uniref:Putrescine transport ATP-binding protein PotA n=2 Tax=Piscinibacter sakaiensis TaxID=1547922 RepID=A0A0K8P9K5_PISS1|nr:putrescine transport ATP-binding protein PotA [Piscinibacter sakaiensis]